MILQTNTYLPLNIDANLKMMIHVGAVSIEPPNIMLEANKQVWIDNTMFDMRKTDFFQPYMYVYVILQRLKVDQYHA